MPSTQTHTCVCSLLVAGIGAAICTCVGCVTLATCAVAYISLYWEAPLRQVPFPPEASPQVVFKTCMCVCMSVFVCRRERDKDSGRKVHLSMSFLGECLYICVHVFALVNLVCCQTVMCHLHMFFFPPTNAQPTFRPCGVCVFKCVP